MNRESKNGKIKVVGKQKKINFFLTLNILNNSSR